MQELTLDIAGSPVFVRVAPVPDGAPGEHACPVLYLHSAPTSSDDWLDLLAITGGYAPDLPGFGRSGKGGHLELGLDAQARFVPRLLDALRLPRVSLVAHGWGGAAGLLAIAGAPERFDRAVLIDTVPLLGGVQLPAVAERLRRPVLGELLMGAMNRRALARILRRAGGDGAAAWPEAAVDAVWRQFDQGTQRAILRLVRSASPAALAELGAGAAAGASVRGPVLVVWGAEDPWLPASWAQRVADALPDARVDLVAGTGHWPWRERPEVGERIVRWLAGDPPR